MADGGEMDEQRLTEIEAREKAATPGPWREDHSLVALELVHQQRFGKGNMSKAEADAYRKDAAFIAHARQDVPDLLAEVREADRALTEAGVTPAEGASLAYRVTVLAAQSEERLFAAQRADAEVRRLQGLLTAAAANLDCCCRGEVHLQEHCARHHFLNAMKAAL